MKEIFGVLIALVVIVGLFFGGRYIALKQNEFFAPREENMRRKVFENTKSYNQGKIQDLVKYRLEYMRADSDIERRAIASTIRHSLADFDESKLSDELFDFVQEIKYQ